MVPRAVGTAARLKQEAEGYKARVVAQAEGDSQRFSSVLTEYRKAPQVTRERMYIDTMRQIYGGINKILVDSRAGSLMYLPLDKLMQATGNTAPAAAAPAPAPSSSPAPASRPSTSSSTTSDSRNRDNARSRDADFR